MWNIVAIKGGSRAGPTFKDLLELEDVAAETFGAGGRDGGAVVVVARGAGEVVVVEIGGVVGLGAFAEAAAEDCDVEDGGHTGREMDGGVHGEYLDMLVS